MVVAVCSQSAVADLDPALRDSERGFGKGPLSSPSRAAAAEPVEDAAMETNDNTTQTEDETFHSLSHEEQVAAAKAKFKALLTQHNRSAKHPDVVKAVEELAALNPTTDAALAASFGGVFESLTRPEFPGRLKQEPENDHIDQYTLGRMSFGIFQPKDLVCTIVKTKNTLKPAPFQEEQDKSVTDKSGNPCRTYTYFLETYIIIHTPKGDFPATLQMNAFCSSAKQPKNRLGVTFVGGTMVPAHEVRSDSTKLALWKQVFEGAYKKAEAERSYFSSIMSYIFKWIFQLTTPTDEEAAKSENCAVQFEMKRCPHGYIDVLYLDDDLRITKGNRGTIVAVERCKE